MRDEDRGERRRAPRELLDQHRVGPEVEAEPAVALGHERAEDAELAEGVDELSRPGAGRVERLDHRHDLLLHELADGEDQLAPLGRLALPRDEGAQPLAVPLDEASRDDRALDLVGALADEHERRVPVIPLEVEVDADARRAEGSERRQRDLVRGLGGVELRHAGLEVAALAAVLQAGRPVGEQAGGPHLRRHVGELRRYVDRAGGVAERVLVCGLRDAHRPRGDVEPPGLEPAHHVLEAAALDAADEVRGRHDDVLEEELRRVDPLVTELRDGLHDLESGVVLLDDEAGHTPVPRLGLRVGEGEEREGVPLAAVRDEHLGPVQHVRVTALLGDGANRLDVRARVGLGERQAAPRLAVRQAGQEAPPLRLGAVGQQDERGHGVAVQHAGERHEAAADLLDDLRVGRAVEAQAAVRLRHQRAEEAELPHAGDQVVRVAVGVLERGGRRAHVVLHELADGGDDWMAHGRFDTTIRRPCLSMTSCSTCNAASTA